MCINEKSSAGAMLQESHTGISIYCTLQIGHTVHKGHQRLHCGSFLTRNIIDLFERTLSSLACLG